MKDYPTHENAQIYAKRRQIATGVQGSAPFLSQQINNWHAYYKNQ